MLIVTSLSESFHRDLNAHQVAASVDQWRQRLKEDAGNAEAHFALGLSYLNLKLRDAALEHLRKAVILAPEVTDTHYNLALTLFNDGNILVASPDYAEAMKEIDYSARLSPDFREAVGFKHFFHARRLEMVDNAQARAEYAKAIRVCSDIATFHNNLGLCFLRSKQLVEARACYQRAIEMDPNFGLAYSNLCQVMFEEKDYAKGIEVGMKAVSLMGPATLEEIQANAHNNLALCLWQSQRHPEALEHINKALALAPSNNLFQQNAKTISRMTPWRQKFNVYASVFFGIISVIVIVKKVLEIFN